MTKRSLIGLAVLTAALAPAPAVAEEAAASRSALPGPTAQLKPSHPRSPDVFGTVALKAGVTVYDARFRRVASADRGDPLVSGLAAGAASLDPMARIAWVQSEVGRRVRWAHDLEGMGVADYWSNAGDTLRRGVGDSEDIAIVKMQVLKAAGVHPGDLYRSVGRHRTRGAHVLLLVRTQGGFVVLDDQGARPMTPGQHARFTPVMTLSPGISWIHGRRIARSAAAHNGSAGAR